MDNLAPPGDGLGPPEPRILKSLLTNSILFWARTLARYDWPRAMTGLGHRGLPEAGRNKSVQMP